MIFIGFNLLNLALIIFQAAISFKGYYKSSLTLTISYTLVIITVTPYVNLIVISYVICVQFWAISFICFNTRARVF